MEFIESSEFTKQITRFPDEDYRAFQIDLASEPLQGAVMRGCGGFRKARMAFPSAGIGKSGGARVIYLHNSAAHGPVAVGEELTTDFSDGHG